MNKEEFDELWNKTVNSVLYGISAKEIKGKDQINEYLHRMVWDNAWGNKKIVPPERKLLDNIRKENPRKAMDIESILSSMTVSNGWSLYAGIIIVFGGIITFLVFQGGIRVASVIIYLVGICFVIGDVLQSNVNPKKAASKALAKAKEKCDKIFFS